MEFAILGPLRVGGPAGAIELRAPKQRALLAMLLLSYREDAVSSGRLINVLWDEDPPPTASKALQVHVSQLRRALGPENPIVTRPSGYSVSLEPGALDLERFETLIAQARNAPSGDAAELLRDALALFRGTPLVDAPLYGPASGEAERLAELRVEALERRLDLDLELGRDSEIVAELETLTAEHPYRERFHGQLMRALYRAGRQADALEAYRRARHSLVEELGLEPSRELQRLEVAILAQDPSLDAPAAAPAAKAAPPPRAPSPPANLPVPASPLLGRDDDLVTASALLADPDVRLLTLTGPGGIGKTRFALELAHRVGAGFGEGARFVALAPVEESERVHDELEQAIGDPTDRELLIVVDNFEQLLDAAGELSLLLNASPRSKLVVTSRAPLRLAAEHELALGPLAAEPAAALFLRRARAVDPRLQLSNGDEPLIARICDRLDGLPLAIELAAARIKVLSPAEILDRLSRRLDLLSAGPRDAPQRQQTLRAAIGWSYDLLDAETKRLFCELGVFNGGFTLVAAEAVCGPAALDGIAALTDHSLLARGSDRRFTMLETVREYALERLEQSGRLDEVRDHHARAYVELLAGAEDGMVGAELPQWLERLDADRDNVRVAVRHAIVARDAETAVALIAPLWRYWMMRGMVTEGAGLATEVLALGGGAPELRMRATNGAGILAAERGDFTTARTHFEESRELARAVGERVREVRTGANLGILAIYEGDYDAAIQRYQEAVDMARELGDDRTLSLMTQNLGIAHDEAGHQQLAIASLEESIIHARRAADPAHLGSCQQTLARVLMAVDRPRALGLLQESLRGAQELNDIYGIIGCLETAAGAVADGHDPQLGALLWGAASAMRAEAGATRQPDEHEFAARVESGLRAGLGEAGFSATVAEGAALPADEAVARALAIAD